MLTLLLWHSGCAFAAAVATTAAVTLLMPLRHAAAAALDHDCPYRVETYTAHSAWIGDTRATAGGQAEQHARHAQLLAWQVLLPQGVLATLLAVCLWQRAR